MADDDDARAELLRKLENLSPVRISATSPAGGWSDRAGWLCQNYQRDRSYVVHRALTSRSSASESTSTTPHHRSGALDFDRTYRSMSSTRCCRWPSTGPTPICTASPSAGGPFDGHSQLFLCPYDVEDGDFDG